MYGIMAILQTVLTTGLYYLLMPESKTPWWMMTIAFFISSLISFSLTIRYLNKMSKR